jgi:hypothetical protein
MQPLIHRGSELSQSDYSLFNTNLIREEEKGGETGSRLSGQGYPKQPFAVFTFMTGSRNIQVISLNQR